MDFMQVNKAAALELGVPAAIRLSEIVSGQRYGGVITTRQRRTADNKLASAGLVSVERNAGKPPTFTYDLDVLEANFPGIASLAWSTPPVSIRLMYENGLHDMLEDFAQTTINSGAKGANAYLLRMLCALFPENGSDDPNWKLIGRVGKIRKESELSGRDAGEWMVSIMYDSFVRGFIADRKAMLNYLTKAGKLSETATEKLREHSRMQSLEEADVYQP